MTEQDASVAGRDASAAAHVSRLQWFGVLLAGGGTAGWLISWSIGWMSPLMPVLVGVGVVCLTLDWLRKHA